MSSVIEINIDSIVFFQNKSVFEKMMEEDKGTTLLRDYLGFARIFFRDHKRKSKLKYIINYNPVPFYLFTSVIKNATNYSSSHSSTKKAFWENSNCILNIDEKFHDQQVDLAKFGSKVFSSQIRAIDNSTFIKSLETGLENFDDKLIRENKHKKFREAYQVIKPHLCKIVFCEFDYEENYFKYVQELNDKSVENIITICEGLTFANKNLILVNINVNSHNFKVIPHEIIHLTGHNHPNAGGFMDGYNKNDKSESYKSSIMNYHSFDLNINKITIVEKDVKNLKNKFSISVEKTFYRLLKV